MGNTSKTFFKVMQIIHLIIGILFCITIVGAIFGVVCIIAFNRYKSYIEMSNQELIANKSSILGWNIFSTILFTATIVGLVVMLYFTIAINNYINELAQGKTESETSTLVSGFKKLLMLNVN